MSKYSEELISRIGRSNNNTPADVSISSLVPSFTCAIALRPIRKCTENDYFVHFLIGLSTITQVKPGNEANPCLHSMRAMSLKVHYF